MSMTPAAPNPAWVGKSWHSTGDGVVYERDVEVDPYPSRLEAETKLPDAVQKAIDEFVEIAFADSQVKVKLPQDQLRELVKDEFEEWRTISSGNILTLHAHIRVNKTDLEPAYRRAWTELAEVQRKQIAEWRLWHFGPYFLGGFLFLTTVWGYLKVDSATGGRRRGTLRVAAAVAILSIAAAAALAVMA